MDADKLQRNADALRRGLDAFVHRDAAGLQSALHPDVVWHDQGRNRISGDYEGAGEVLAFLGQIFTMAGDSIHYDIIAALTGEQYVAAVLNLQASLGAKAVSDRSIFLARIEDDLIAEVWAYAWDPYALDEFWGEADS